MAQGRSRNSIQSPQLNGFSSNNNLKASSFARYGLWIVHQNLNFLSSSPYLRLCKPCLGLLSFAAWLFHESSIKKSSEYIVDVVIASG